MRRALELAQSVWGTTHPNPMVGAVLVEEGKIVGEGATAPDGGAHAERLALLARGKPPGSKSTLYTTMEPCSTHGRTGACVKAIIEAEISRVVVGAIDPNPDHAGKGLQVLRDAGIEVIDGVLAEDCTDLNLIFNHWISRNEPILAVKTATTLDGRIACRTGDSQWITSELSRADVMKWRRLFPAIAVGAGTVKDDNPRLTARREGEDEWCPWRFVFDGLLSTVDDRNMPALYTDDYRDRTIVVTTPHAGVGYVRKLEDLGVKVWRLPTQTHRVGLKDFRLKCAEEKITGVYFEGGSRLLSELMRDRQIDYMFAYRAPMFFADDRAKPVMSGLRTEKIAHAIRMDSVRHEILGADVLTRGRMAYPDEFHVDETVFSLG